MDVASALSKHKTTCNMNGSHVRSPKVVHVICKFCRQPRTSLSRARTILSHFLAQIVRRIFEPRTRPMYFAHHIRHAFRDSLPPTPDGVKLLNSRRRPHPSNHRPSNSGIFSYQCNANTPFTLQPGASSARSKRSSRRIALSTAGSHSPWSSTPTSSTLAIRPRLSKSRSRSSRTRTSSSPQRGRSQTSCSARTRAWLWPCAVEMLRKISTSLPVSSTETNRRSTCTYELARWEGFRAGYCARFAWR